MTPVSYDSLKTIIRYMNANQRFDLVRKCPSLKNIEKKVPLTLDFLSVESSYATRINGTWMNISLYKHYHDGNTPKIVQEYNEEGFFHHDIDRWGFETPSDRFVKTPGDVILNPSGENWDEYDEHDEYYGMGKELELQSDLKKVKLEMESGGSRHDELKNRMEEIESQLLSYSCREKNTDLPYDTFIQCCFNRRKVEMVQYTRKLYEAMKYFMNRILGGRRDPIYVKKFYVCQSNQIIRFPEGVKLNIRKVIQHSINPIILDALSPVIDEKSYPCKHFDISNPDLLNQPFTRNAEELTMSSFLIGFEKWSTLPNRKVNILDLYGFIKPENYYEVIKQLIEIRKRVGTCFKFIFAKVYIIKDVFDLLKERFGNGIKMDEGRAVVKMGSWYNIIITHGVENSIATPYNPRSWYIKIEVVEGEV
ncbi:hypothetical protein CAEBREN_13427 [Caenorhabditis brenneri]|uniref:F-box domain-containing protein n=1 Tax=Caenorhabditis brenneri TaxID=135651 RepID=G0NM08_CAEBE|nr:hypothetical protein CAEBREN_13427 [Caenorhabditis brenneri]